MNMDIEEITKTVNNIHVNSIILRISRQRLNTANEGYLITANNCSEFRNNLQVLVKEGDWNANARFLIIISNCTKDNLNVVFDVLLRYHVVNVLIMNTEEDPDLYTYNPFENYGCGKRYDRVIEYGKCTGLQDNLYPNKLVTGLRNCSFDVACSHSPPYIIDPRTNKKGTHLAGVEENVLKEIGKMEEFNINLTYTNDAETFTTIEKDMSAVGPMRLLQKNDVDIILGGMILTHQRGQAFQYIWGHLAYTEELSYQVKKATNVPSWKNMYLEFETIVWCALLFAFILYFVIFTMLTCPKDKGRVVLDMIGFLFIIGNNVRGNYFTRCLFIHWVLFAYLINAYYQSSLVSLTTNPSKNYQISNEDDIKYYKLQPCLCNAIQAYLTSVGIPFTGQRQKEGCEALSESIKTVGKSDKLYTVVLRSLYTYNKYNYSDDWGDAEIYTFNKAIAKAIYAMYFYKGFPMLDKFLIYTLRLREIGLVDSYFQNLNWEKGKMYSFKVKTKKYNVNVPWCVLTFGSTISTGVFFIEIILKWISRRVNKFSRF